MDIALKKRESHDKKAYNVLWVRKHDKGTSKDVNEKTNYSYFVCTAILCIKHFAVYI